MVKESLKANADESKVMLLGGNEGSMCKISVTGRHLRHYLRAKYLEFVLDEMNKDVVE